MTMEESALQTVDRIDVAEAWIVSLGGAIRSGGNEPLPIRHHFTPGLYVREMFAPAGSLVTSRIHKTRHPFVISKGSCSIFIEGEGWVRMEAPHFGITEPGTRRIGYFHEDTIWTTFHATDATDVDEIEAEILEPHQNPLLAPQMIEGGA